MVIVDKNELFLAGNNGEKITVVVKSENTVHMVTYNLDGTTGVMPSTGPQSSRLEFNLNQSANDPTKLLLVFHFASSQGGGIYRALVVGESGPPFGRLFKQLSSPATAAMYTFDVV
ncbi:MAG: hypothetical protein QOF62_3890 [Pyrinomonadaceae bacterium]|jgi:hypothetical protein|nr:hypothetical protein [Pyrinomonadaceae bacterium]